MVVVAEEEVTAVEGMAAGAAADVAVLGDVDDLAVSTFVILPMISPVTSGMYSGLRVIAIVTGNRSSI